MPERHRYKNPPIEEALCEFRFQPGQDWNLTIPGRLQSVIGDEYPGKPRERRFVEVGVRAEGGMPSDLSVGGGLVRVQLTTADGTRMVGVGPDVLSIHMLRPYQDRERSDGGGWEEFQPRIVEALGAYWPISEPQGVIRVGVRYINKIVVPQARVKVEDYLTCALPEVEGLPSNLAEFMSRVDYRYDDDMRIVLSQSTIEAPQGHVGFLLDLDAIWERPDPVGINEASEIAADLRDRERDAFEAVITERARELFDAD